MKENAQATIMFLISDFACKTLSHAELISDQKTLGVSKHLALIAPIALTAIIMQTIRTLT